MIYVSLSDIEEEKKVQRVLLSVIKKEKVVYAKRIQNKSKRFELSKKAKIVICDEVSEIIENFNYKHQIVIVYKKINEEISKKIYFTRNLYIYKKISDLEDILAYEIDRLDSKKKIFKFVIVALILIIGIFIFDNFNDFNNKNLTKAVENKKTTKVVVEKNIKKEKNYKSENIVFLGDSITDYYDLDKYYKNMPVINSGTAGYKTNQILDELDERVIKYNPTKVFLLIGTNDLAFTNLTKEEIADNIVKIADKINEKRPNTQIYIESIFPVNTDKNEKKVSWEMVDVRENKSITAINNYVKEKIKNKKYTYVDMYKLLIGKDGNLNINYSVDGLHMNDNGYKIITKEIMKYINGEEKDEN